MVAQQTSRNHDYIKERVEKHGSLEEYLSSISSNTIKNYKKNIEDYIDTSIHTSEEKDSLKKLIVNKTKKYGLLSISKAVETILDNIEESSVNHDSIIIQDDYSFLLVFLLIHINNKEKSNLYVGDITKKQDDLIFEVRCTDNIKKEFAVINRKGLFEKLFKTIQNHSKRELLFRIKDFTKIIELQFSRAGIFEEYDKSFLKRYVTTKYISVTM